jgi:alkylresorcinol/alkylpyrone synthase
MPHVVSAATALPSNRVSQADTREAMAGVCRGDRAMERLLPVFDRTGVETRYFVRPLDWYAAGPSFESRNKVYAASGLELAEQAARSCLEMAGVGPGAVDAIYFVTTTGLMTPSMDARLVSRLGLRSDVRRSPLFGLGCAGGAGALVRATDNLRAFPAQHALVVSVELCSLVFSPVARTATDLVGTALFGDGAAAVLVAGDETGGGGPTVVATRTHLFQDAPDLMGWNFTDDGMRLVLSREVPQFVATGVAPVVKRFLDDHDVALTDIDHFVLHPGGAKVMATYRSALGLDEDDLRIARDTMRRYGNQSSASVLFMLSDLVASGRPNQEDAGLMMALGPGFAAEMLTLSW